MRLPEETSPCISLLSLHSAGKAHILLFFGGTSRVQRRQWHPTSVFLPGKCPGRRSLVGCSPRGCGRVGHDWATSLLLSCIGEGNGNPCQYSCLDNPRDRGACWAAVYGVTQSRTWLTRFSSSSSTPILNLPPPSSPDLSGLFQSTGFGCPASCIQLALIILFYIW